MLNYILPFLIFLSLGIIIYIVSRHLPDFKKDPKNFFDRKNEVARNKVFSLVMFILKKTKAFFIFLAETVVKKNKEILHLIHFWLIRLKQKKNKKDELSNEIEAKEKLIEEEEESLEKIINDKLATADEQDLVRNLEKIEKEKKEFKKKKEEIDEIKETVIKEKKVLKKESAPIIEEELFQISETEKKKERHRKLSNFFLDGNKNRREKENFRKEEKKADENKNVPVEEEDFFGKEKKPGKGNFFQLIKKVNPLIYLKKIKKEKVNENDFLADTSVGGKNNYGEEFSDGIIKIDEYQKPREEENLLMKEVVRVERNSVDIDDEIGVDRKILEKKLIQKIVKNPKQIENYRQLGELYLKIENYAEAVECYKQILKVHPRDLDSKRKLEKINFLKRVNKKNNK